MKIRLFFSILLLLVSAPLFAQEDDYRIIVAFSCENNLFNYTINSHNSASFVSLSLYSLSSNKEFYLQDFTRNEGLKKLEQIRDTIRVQKNKGKEVTVFFYYAGHGGATKGGKDFLVLINKSMADTSSMQTSLLYVWEVESYLAEADITLLFLDKCRNVMEDTLAYSKEAYDKVQKLQAHQKQLRMYSTQLGELSSAGYYDENSTPFASAVCKFIPNYVSGKLRTRRTLEVLRNATLYNSAGYQIPSYTSTLPENFFSRNTKDEIVSGHLISEEEKRLKDFAPILEKYKDSLAYFPELDTLAQGGNTLAKYLAGMQYHDTTLSLTLRKKLFGYLKFLCEEQEAGRGYSNFQTLATSEVASSYLREDGFTPKDIARAIKLLNDNCSEGLAYSCYELGRVYENIQEYDSAVLKYKFAREKNIPDAAYSLALLYEDRLASKKVKKKEILALYGDAIQLGNTDAMYELARNFLWGWGVKKDKEKAYWLFSLAADMGDNDARLEVFDFYKDGIYVEKDIKKAYDIILPLANEGNLKAIHKIGLLYYLYPEEVHSFCTTEEALYCTVEEWLEECSRQGSLECMGALVYSIYDKKDDKRALYWAEKMVETEPSYKYTKLHIEKLKRRIAKKARKQQKKP